MVPQCLRDGGTHTRCQAQPRPDVSLKTREVLTGASSAVSIMKSTLEHTPRPTEAAFAPAIAPFLASRSAFFLYFAFGEVIAVGWAGPMRRAEPCGDLGNANVSGAT